MFLNIRDQLLLALVGIVRVLEIIIEVSPMCLKRRGNVDRLLQKSGISWSDRATIYHQTWSIMPRHAHDYTGHVLVASCDCNARIVELSTCHGFDGIRYDLSSLQTKAHALATHSDAVRNANGVVLPSQHFLVLNRSFNCFTNVQKMHVARVALPPHTANAYLRIVLELVFIRHASGVQHRLRRWEVMFSCQGRAELVQS